MSKERQPICRDFIVAAHKKTEKADKEPVFKVVLKTKKISPEDQSVIKMTITGGSEELHDNFPLNETLEVQIRNPQTRLEDHDQE